MLEQALTNVYVKFKLNFYQEMFNRIRSRETSLSTVELFCVEVIHALGNPTVAEFSSFINVSGPNATYKVNCLVKKGYIKKVRSEIDRREFHLEVTDKYYEYYSINQDYIKTVSDRAAEKFSKEQVELFTKMLETMSAELMPEVDIPAVKLKK